MNTLMHPRPSLELLMSLDDDPLARIESHEQVCAERYRHIFYRLKTQDAKLNVLLTVVGAGVLAIFGALLAVVLK